MSNVCICELVNVMTADIWRYSNLVNSSPIPFDVAFGAVVDMTFQTPDIQQIANSKNVIQAILVPLEIRITSSTLSYSVKRTIFIFMYITRESYRVISEISIDWLIHYIC